MIEYIYFVNCIDGEEEAFDALIDAKAFALSKIAKEPEISQTEIIRNDFGECIDSTNLGVIWTWKEEMSDILDRDELTFSKAETLEDYDFDNEFDYSDMVFDEDFEIGDTVEVEFTEGENPARIDKYYKQNLQPVPADMTIESLVEAMEENEDTVECKMCFKLFPKEDCFHETGLGYLCPLCIMDLDSKGMDLEFTRDTLGESYNPKELVHFEYQDLKTVISGPKRDVDDWKEYDYIDDYTYEVAKEDVAITIWENFMDDEDDALIPGGADGLEAIEKDNNLWNAFMRKHFDALFDKHYDELLNYYREAAEEDFSNSVTFDDYQERRDHWYDESLDSGPELIDTDKDALVDRETFRKRLTMCPECGENTFDPETQFCINCGFN